MARVQWKKVFRQYLIFTSKSQGAGVSGSGFRAWALRDEGFMQGLGFRVYKS